jgi:hypothetical protein
MNEALYIVSQVAIAVLGCTAVMLVGSKDARTRRFACIFGLSAEPFWLYSSIAAHQWGVVVMCAIYTVGWVRGIRNNQGG